MKTILAAVALALLSGCASVGVHWHKEGATKEDLELAQKICGRESSDYNFVDPDRSPIATDPYGGGERRVGSSGGSVYRDCMERAGWRRVRGEPPPRAT